MVGTGHITGPGIAGYNVMFDFDSKGRAGQCYGSLQAEEGYDQIYISRSSFWVLGGKWILEGQEWKQGD